MAMSLNTQGRDSSYPSYQREALNSAFSATDNQQPGEEQQTPDPIVSPHGTTDEQTFPAVEAHDAPAPAQNSAFQPFFTLVEDQQTGEYYHPTVHYIFSDDDTDIITAAALRSLESQQAALSSSTKEQLHKEDTDPLDEDKPALLPPPIPGIQENYLVLDIEPESTAENTAATTAATHPTTSDKQPSTSPAEQTNVGGGTAHVSSQPPFRVTAAKSFSPTWQVLQTEMVPAPRFENNEASDTTGHGLMLKIHGTSGLPYVSEPGKEHGAQRLEDMMDQFAKRMSELQTVIDAAGVEKENVTGEEGGKGQDKEESGHKKEQEEGSGDGTGGNAQKEQLAQEDFAAEDD